MTAKRVSHQATVSSSSSSSKYECNNCMFYTNKSTDYTRHLSTQKHKILSSASTPVVSSSRVSDPDSNSNSSMLDDETANSSESPSSSTDIFNINTNMPPRACQMYTCRFCDKQYIARNSLWYHEKRCKQHHVALQLQLQNKTKDEVIDRLLKDNAEMMKLLKEIVPRIGPTTMIMNNTTHNKFNINVFLNEHCKDALNISDFVNSIKITMHDLKLTEERGIVESISNVLVQGLNDMDICKRPIHCTDLKRDILYVKENEQWERDETQEHLRKSVNDIAYKQILSVENWKNTLPNLNCDDSLQLQYNTLLMKTLADTTGEKDVKKIVKSVCKHVYLSETLLL
jgi:hypothetical protein